MVLSASPGDAGLGLDNAGGAGPNYVVDFTCANFVVHDKPHDAELDLQIATASRHDLDKNPDLGAAVTPHPSREVSLQPGGAGGVLRITGQLPI